MSEKQPTLCDHIVANIDGRDVPQSAWPLAKSEHEAAIAFFNTTRRAVPHPGFETRCNFCPLCGDKIDPATFQQPVPQVSGIPYRYKAFTR